MYVRFECLYVASMLSSSPPYREITLSISHLLRNCHTCRIVYLFESLAIIWWHVLTSSVDLTSVLLTFLITYKPRKYKYYFVSMDVWSIVYLMNWIKMYYNFRNVLFCCVNIKTTEVVWLCSNKHCSHMQCNQCSTPIRCTTGWIDSQSRPPTTTLQIICVKHSHSISMF